MNVKNSIFDRLLLKQKLMIVGVVAALSVVIPFSLYLYSTQKNIASAKRESQGIPMSRALLQTILLTQEHSVLSKLALGEVVGGNTDADDNADAAGNTGGTHNAKERLDKQAALDKAVLDLDALVKSIPDPMIKNDWPEIQKNWQKLKKEVSYSQISASESLKAHSALVKNYLDFLERISDYFGLSLDPDAETYFMIQSFLYSNPKLTETLGKIRDLGTHVLAQEKATPEELTRLTNLLEVADEQRKYAEDALIKAYANKKRLGVLTETATKNYQIATKLLRNEILLAKNISYSPSGFFDVYTKTLDAFTKRNVEGFNELSKLLSERAANLFTYQLLVAGAFMALMAFVALIILSVFRSITLPVANLVEVMNKLASGDTTVRANMESVDEIGLMGRQFDMMVDQRERIREKIQEENEQLNDSVINILQAVARISQRDLTVPVPVAEDITGPVADSLNQLTDEITRVLKQVVQIADDVSNVSQQINVQSDNVISIANEEKRQVEQSAIELNNASEVMMDISKLAQSCNDAAEKAIKNTDKALETVLGTVQGITTIRDTIRETEKRIKRLGERSQEIGGVVTLINNIAERTHTLAINASMHAASAGEAGRGFAVVANEVQKLAENAREATSQISSLVNNIQVETNDTVTTMNDAITQVVQGTSLAQQAGSQMKETQDTTASLVQLVQRIAENSKVQSETTQRLRDTALNIQKSTEQTFEELQNQGKQTERLVDFSGKLVESVGVFTLPAA